MNTYIQSHTFLLSLAFFSLTLQEEEKYFIKIFFDKKENFIDRRKHCATILKNADDTLSSAYTAIEEFKRVKRKCMELEIHQ